MTSAFIPRLALLTVAVYAAANLWGDATAQTTTKETVTQSPSNVTTERSMTSQNPRSGQINTYQQTTSENMMIPGGRIVNFASFDMNKDSILSTTEIGTLLFGLYDMDGNGIINNIEYERRAVITVMPIEKNTVISYDFDGDWITDQTQFTYETFMQDTALTRFDKNQDGLSPHEFLDLSFNIADANHDKTITINEWQGAYIPRINQANRQKASYNK